jgi:FKBP-type peptidyl-prolyl cis-trans isomerase (trigger factor)
MSGMTIDNLHTGYRLGAKEDVDARLVLEAIAKKEAFEVNDDDILEQLKKVMLPNQDPEKLLSDLSEDRRKSIVEDLLNQKALDFVIDKAVAIESVD